MSGHERRADIVKSVLPLFAKQGFARTTTKDLAEAAGVSEALLYKHFPSKESLYSEIQSFGCQDKDSALDRIGQLEPSTSTLVHIMYFLMRCLSIGNQSDLISWETKHRLVLNSCLEDGSYPRFLFKNHFATCYPKIEACLNEAEIAGDLVPAPVSKRNRVLFAYHVACMIGIMHLPEQPVVDYQASREKVLNEAVWFVLRGIGLTEKAIRTYYNPEAISLFFETAKQ